MSHSYLCRICESPRPFNDCGGEEWWHTCKNYEACYETHLCPKCYKDMDGFCSDWCKEKAKTRELDTFKEGAVLRLTALEDKISRLTMLEDGISRLTALEDAVSRLTASFKDTVLRLTAIEDAVSRLAIERNHERSCRN